MTKTERSDDYTYPYGVPPNDLPAALRPCRCGHMLDWHRHFGPPFVISYCVSEGECVGCDMFRPVFASDKAS